MVYFSFSWNCLFCVKTFCFVIFTSMLITYVFASFFQDENIISSLQLLDTVLWQPILPSMAWRQFRKMIQRSHLSAQATLSQVQKWTNSKCVLPFSNFQKVRLFWRPVMSSVLIGAHQHELLIRPQKPIQNFRMNLHRTLFAPIDLLS